MNTTNAKPNYQQFVSQYLAERRAFGYAMKTEERILNRFAEFADRKELETLTADSFLEWKSEFGNANLDTWKRRLSVYRVFAKWLQISIPETEIPPSELIKSKGYSRQSPYIYTKKEIDSLLIEAMKLRSTLGLRRLGIYSLIGLISVTGMRINEALGLNIDDVDFDFCTLHIRESKGNAERLIPISPTTCERLKHYRRETVRLTNRSGQQFFVVEGQRPITEYTARYAFAHISQNIGLREKQIFSRHGKGPRIHDLRHTFVVNSLIDAYKNKENIGRRLHQLVDFLGHKKIEYTYWYIEAVPELMHLASMSLETYLDDML